MASFVQEAPTSPPVPARIEPSPETIVAYVMEAVCTDGSSIVFATVYRGPREGSVVESQRRLQWFVRSYVGLGVLREVGTGDELPEGVPSDTAFVVDHLPNEVFWCGDGCGGPIDDVLCGKAADLAAMLWSSWNSTADMMVVDLFSGASDA